MVDETLILRKLSELDQYYRQITEYEENYRRAIFRRLEDSAYH